MYWIRTPVSRKIFEMLTNKGSIDVFWRFNFQTETPFQRNVFYSNVVGNLCFTKKPNSNTYVSGNGNQKVNVN